MKKLSYLLFAIITAVIFNSCSKEEEGASDFTGYYNSKSVYQNDLLLRIVSSTGTSSFFGTGSGSDLNINTSLYVNKTTGLKTITRINKTLDSIRVYDLDKPELGGLLYVTKDNNVSVYDFEFLGSKNKINTTFNYGTFPVPAGKYNLSSTNNNEAESIIDKAIEKFYKFTQTLGGSEIFDSIKESVSKAKDNAIKNWENTKESINESSNYISKLFNKNPEPIKLPLEENPINQDEQEVIDDAIEEPFDCNTSTIAMTISDPNISNGLATVSARGIGGAGNYSYKWSDGQVGDYAVFSESGTYSVTVTDGNGCSISSSVEIKIPGIQCLIEESTIPGTWNFQIFPCSTNPSSSWQVLQFNADHTITGFIGNVYGSHTWSLDCTTGILTCDFGTGFSGQVVNNVVVGQRNSTDCWELKKQ